MGFGAWLSWTSAAETPTSRAVRSRPRGRASWNPVCLGPRARTCEFAPIQPSRARSRARTGTDPSRPASSRRCRISSWSRPRAPAPDRSSNLRWAVERRSSGRRVERTVRKRVFPAPQWCEAQSASAASGNGRPRGRLRRRPPAARSPRPPAAPASSGPSAVTGSPPRSTGRAGTAVGRSPPTPGRLLSSRGRLLSW